MHIFTIKISFRFSHCKYPSCRKCVEYIFVILLSTNFATYNFNLITCLNKVWQPKETICYKSLTFIQQQPSEDVLLNSKLLFTKIIYTLFSTMRVRGVWWWQCQKYSLYLKWECLVVVYTPIEVNSPEEKSFLFDYFKTLICVTTLRKQTILSRFSFLSEKTISKCDV